MIAALRASCCVLLALALVRPSSTPPIADGDVWVRQSGTPASYIARLSGVSGVVRTPKLTPPAGATVIVQILGAGLGDDRVSWTTPSTPWQPGPLADIDVWCSLLLRVREGGSLVPSVGASSVGGVARRFHVGATYPPLTAGTDRVEVSSCSSSSAAVFVGSGAPISVEVAPLWTLNIPTPSMSASHSETYTVDVRVSW